MHTTRLRQAANFPPLKPIEPGRDERAIRVDTTISRATRERTSTTCAGRFSKPAGSPGSQTGDLPLFDNEVHVPDI